MRHPMFRASGLLGMMAILAIGVTACRVPSPLTYPLILASPVDATTEVQQLLGTAPPAGQGPAEIARQLATALTGQREGCEVLTIAQVVWVAPTEPATAAVEVRGLCDDAVAGLWYEITITGNGPGGWITATKQDVCARGVSGPVCV